MNSCLEEFWSSLPLGRGVRLLEKHSLGLAALDKPAGALSHPNTKEDEVRSLLTCVYDPSLECYQWTSGRGRERLWLLNRLDSGTSGVVLVAAQERVAQALKAQFRKKQIQKVYIALVFGAPSVPRQVWRDLLSVEKKAGQIRTRGGGNIPSESLMQLLAKGRVGNQQVSLLQLEPRTGRSHQLRVQCALRKLPIVGDGTYGDFGANRIFAKETASKRLFLHSSETRLEFTFEGQAHAFKAKASLPEAFQRISLGTS